MRWPAHTITAVYGGDAQLHDLDVVRPDQTVNQGATTTALGVLGQPVRLRPVGDVHGDGDGGSAGRRHADRDGDVQGRRDHARHRHADGSGVATFGTSALALAGHTITAVYGGDAQLHDLDVVRPDAGRSTRAATTTALGVVGQPVRVRPVGDLHGDRDGDSAGRRHADRHGDVQGRRDDARHRHADCQRRRDFTSPRRLRWPATPSRRSTAATRNFTTSTSSGLTQTVNQGATTTALGVLGQPVRVRPVGDVHGDGRGDAPGAGTPTGTVTFKDGATTLGTGTLAVSGAATFITSALALAGHTDHGGLRRRHELHDLDVAGLTQTVNQARRPRRSASSANPSVFGQSVTFTATVTVQRRPPARRPGR